MRSIWFALSTLACAGGAENAKPSSLILLEGLEAGREGVIHLPDAIRFRSLAKGEIGDLGLPVKYTADDLAINRLEIGKEKTISWLGDGDAGGTFIFKHVPAWAPINDILKLKSRGAFFARLGTPLVMADDQIIDWGFFTVQEGRLLALFVIARFNDDGSVRGAAFQAGFVDIPDRNLPSVAPKTKDQ